ncbi:MAG TPA: S8 family serine peptidase [Acidimicrobiales bacterium]|nr:S8 family serine peptidase [Acidimicrobiales bacterium]
MTTSPSGSRPGSISGSSAGDGRRTVVTSGARRRWVLAAGVALSALPTGLPPAGAVAPAPAPDDPLFARQWNLAMIQLPRAWSVSDGTGATVALLDTGVAYEDYDDGARQYFRAPDLAGTRFVAGWDFVDGDAHPDDSLNDRYPEEPAHGTHKASIIAETTGNGIGAAGVAPGAAIMPVRVLDTGGNADDQRVAAGLRFAVDHGAQVVNISIAGPRTPALAAAVQYAAAKGVTMVAASGNGLAGQPQVDYPAAYPEVIAVGAVRRDRTPAPYANYGDALDLVAPGGDTAADPKNGGIRQQSFVGTPDGFCYCQVDGTSAAAPHVAGVAALLVASGLARTPDQVRHALESSALDLGPPGWDPIYGHGLVQAAGALAAASAASADLSVTVPDGSSTLVVHNAGPAPATGVVVSDRLGPGATVGAARPAQGSCQPAGDRLTCSLGDLAVGATVRVEVDGTVPAAGAVHHRASVRGDQGDGVRANDTSPPGRPVAAGTPGRAAAGRPSSGPILAGAALAVAAAGLALARRRRRDAPAPAPAAAGRAVAAGRSRR